MKLESLLGERDLLRNNWRNVRTERLELRDIIIENEGSLEAVRKNRGYKKLKKEQRLLSKMIKHLEMKIQKENFRENINDAKK